MSTKAENIRDPNSCLNKAADDEPIFVLRANDPSAARIVEMWADQYASNKEFHQGALTLIQKTKFEDAMQVAAHMRTWAHLRAGK